MKTRIRAVRRHDERRIRGDCQPATPGNEIRTEGPPGAQRGAGDVRRFSSAYAVSALGSGVGAGALPLVAIMVVHASDWQVSLLAVLSGLAGVAVAVPLGPWIEFHRKRPAMIAADLVRFAALASIPATAVLGILSYGQLCAVAVVMTAATIVSNAASHPYLKALAPAGEWARVNSRLASTSWAAETIGPPVGGLLVTATSPVASILVDAFSYLLAACGWRRIRRLEPRPPRPAGQQRWLADTVGGWQYIHAHRTLRRLFINAMIFGGCIMASSPLIAVYLLRDLRFTPLQYGIALGAPCAAGMLGSLLAPAIIRRAGLGRTLLISGAARCLWMSPILLAEPTTGGLVLIIAAESALLLCAGVFNPAFATYRMTATADTHLSRVVGAWAMTGKLVQPACIAAAGLLAATSGIRTALAVLSMVLLTSAAALPWTALRHHTDTEDAQRVATGQRGCARQAPHDRTCREETPMTITADAFSHIPVDYYTHNQQRGETPHRSDPQAIHRDLTSLDVPDGARVLEIGTGSGYSSALLAELAGPHGQVISVDVSEHLAGWANLLHHQRGLTTVRCYCADGMAGFPAKAPFDRIVTWCTPPRLPKTWIEQLTPDGRLVACLPIAALPSTTVIATITTDADDPRVQALTSGGYAQSTAVAVDDALTIPGRWIDWSIRHREPSWIAIGWRRDDDWLHTGARTTLDRLLNPGHTETYDRTPLDWRSWSTYTAVIGHPHLSIAALRAGARGIGHTTKTSAAVVQTDGTIIADSPHSPSLSALHTWLQRWEHAGRPAADLLTPTLIPNDNDVYPGWDLRLTF